MSDCHNTFPPCVSTPDPPNVIPPMPVATLDNAGVAVLIVLIVGIHTAMRRVRR